MGTLLEGLQGGNLIKDEIEHLCKCKDSYIKKLGYDISKIKKDKKSLSKELIRSLKNSDYVHSQVDKKIITGVGGKKRVIYKLALSDRILNGAIHKIIVENYNKYYLDNIYSYRKGMNRLTAIKKLEEYVELHKKAKTTPKERGIFVLRFDVKSYGESIPVHENSALWAQLENIFSKDSRNLGFDKKDMELLKAFIIPKVFSAKREPAENKYGIIDGAPVSAFLLNLYLEPLDRYLSGIKNSYYARYGDDIMFACEDVATAQMVQAQTVNILTSLELRANKEKEEMVYFNAAGRPSPEGVKGSQKVTFLGISLFFNGKRELKSEKIEMLFKAYRLRIENLLTSIKQTDIQDPELIGKMVCKSLNEGFIDQSIFTIDQLQALKFVNSKFQLKHIDYFFALILANKLSGIEGVRAFRKVPYRKIRSEWRLESIAHKYRYSLDE